MNGLYGLPLEGAAFENFCGGNQGGEHETCVEVGAIPDALSAFVLRDGKPEGAGRELRFTTAELDAFALGWASRRGLTLSA
ncbi:DUF397 domain-containing protein [Streptomyces sp. NPDC004726]